MTRYSSPRAGHCRFCDAPLSHAVVDLGMSPLCESYIAEEQRGCMEPYYPLRVFVCPRCFLMQLEEFVSDREIFREYAYFSSYSSSWLAHARAYVEQSITRFGLTSGSFVVEVASNDGYLLQYFVERGIPCLGVEPAANVARVARERNVPTLVEFFGADCAERLVRNHRPADVVVGNNVLAQVHNLNDFVAGLRIVLAPRGTVTLEFPHLMRLIEENQFDTIYHEHFSYFSFRSAQRIFAAHGLTVYDVQELPTHGGSLRIYARHDDDLTRPITEQARRLAEWEERAGVDTVDYYGSFAERVKQSKWKLLEFLITARRGGKSVVGYGAPGKGNTLLNYCGVRTDFLDYTVDRSPHKQGKYLPGTHIPIFAPHKIRETKPDYVLILPWNLKEEIMCEMAEIRSWGGAFVVPIPEVTVYP
jgi:SAM-dependent methyltransferase